MDLIIEFDLITKFREVFIEHLQRVRLVNGGRLLLRTHGPVAFGTCIRSKVEIIHSQTFHDSGPWISNIPQYFYFVYFQVMWEPKIS